MLATDRRPAVRPPGGRRAASGRGEVVRRTSATSDTGDCHYVAGRGPSRRRKIVAIPVRTWIAGHPTPGRNATDPVGSDVSALAGTGNPPTIPPSLGVPRSYIGAEKT